MRTTLSRAFAFTLVFAGMIGALVPPALAYTRHLHSEEVDEAFSLGQSTDLDTVKHFFEKYSRQLDCPPRGPCVSSIEFRTPFEEVAVRARERGSNYTEQDAEQDYAARSSVVSVRVIVLYPLDVSNDQSNDSPADESPNSDSEYSFYGYRIRVSQEHALKPTQVRGEPVYFGGSQCSYCGGEEIILDFPPDQLDANLTHIEVATPDGQRVKADFDLRALP